MRITFVSPGAYAILCRPELRFAGGAELQQIQLARWMRDEGHEVSFVVADYGQEQVEEHEGFRFYKSFALGVGNRKLRFVPDMRKLRSAIRQSRPEIVNQRSTSFYTGQCCFFSHEYGAAFSFSLGIDYNCYRNLKGRAPWAIQELYRWGVEHSDLILAQYRTQAELMRTNFRCDPKIVPNILEVPEEVTSTEVGKYVLWVGSLAKRKRPEVFLELARGLPDLKFVLVGGPGEDRGYDSLMREEARNIPNLEWRGYIPPWEMEPVFQNARLLVGTSILEGFPNVYLQAWAHGVPVISVVVDPDETIVNMGLGVVVGRVEKLQETVLSWWNDTYHCSEAGKRAQEYVKENHAIDQVAPRTVKLFEQAIRDYESG